MDCGHEAIKETERSVGGCDDFEWSWKGRSKGWKVEGPLLVKYFSVDKRIFLF